MATLQDLKAVVRDTLVSRGALSEVKARIRAEVFAALDEPGEARPQLSSENAIINELIREYLNFNGYKYAASVLQAESGQALAPLDRDFLSHELNVIEDKITSSVPLLYCVVTHFLKRNRSRSVSPRRGRPTSRSPTRTRSLSQHKNS